MNLFKMLLSVSNYWYRNILVKNWSILFLLAFISLGCGEDERPTEQFNWTKEKSISLGEELAREENLRIQLFIERQTDFNFKKTGSGLYYDDLSKSRGRNFAKEGDVACIDLQIMLLDKTVCYETKPDECLELKIDKSEAETGLQEALKLMNVGDHFMLIIPSHLAHGLIGDQDKIPPLSTLLVDISLIELER